MSKKIVKKVLPRPEYQSPYESKEYKSKKLYSEDNEDKLEEQDAKDEKEKDSTWQEESDLDQYYVSPYASPEEKMETTYIVRGTPSYNPCVEKELAKKKRYSLPRQEYQSPFQADEHKKVKLYKEDLKNSEESLDESKEDASSLYHSPYDRVLEQKKNQEVDEEYNSFHLPYIETRVTSEIRGNRVMNLAYENAGMDEDEQTRFNNLSVRIAFILALALVYFLIAALLSLPPRLRSFQGELGDYQVYHYKQIIVTPEGESIEYKRTVFRNALYYTFFMPDGKEIRTSSLNVGVFFFDYREILHTTEHQDLYDSLIQVEENYRTDDDSYPSSSVSAVLFVKTVHMCLGLFIAFRPFLLVDFAVFCYPSNSPEYRTHEFHKKCRNVAIAYALFALTPIGAKFHTTVILKAVQLVIGGWVNALGSLM